MSTLQDVYIRYKFESFDNRIIGSLSGCWSFRCSLPLVFRMIPNPTLLVLGLSGWAVSEVEFQLGASRGL